MIKRFIDWWAAVKRLFVKKETRVSVTDLSEAVRREVLENASFLYREGVDVRELLPGEKSDAPPEVGGEPLRRRE